MSAKEEALTGRRIVDIVQGYNSKYLVKLLTPVLQASHLDQCSPSGLNLWLINYEINESTMTFSDKLVACRELVEKDFHERLTKLSFVTNIPSNLAFVDPSGQCVSGSIECTLPIQEVVEALSGTGLYKTLELGCCRTYSHNILGSRCLTAVIIGPASPSGANSPNQYILSTFSS